MKIDQLKSAVCDLDQNSLIELARTALSEVAKHQTTTHHAVIAGLSDRERLEWAEAFKQYPDPA
ncbi:hypothetical protein [Antarctobacter jejuensis]|uniref:hypothetical protein n=1 Tax=Antarctobacter jejuensis TaxID=1439938 RepID=UPI003FD05779